MRCIGLRCLFRRYEQESTSAVVQHARLRKPRKAEAKAIANPAGGLSDLSSTHTPLLHFAGISRQPLARVNSINWPGQKSGAKVRDRRKGPFRHHSGTDGVIGVSPR